MYTRFHIVSILEIGLKCFLNFIEILITVRKMFILVHVLFFSFSLVQVWEARGGTAARPLKTSRHLNLPLPQCTAAARRLHEVTLTRRHDVSSSDEVRCVRCRNRARKEGSATLGSGYAAFCNVTMR